MNREASVLRSIEMIENRISERLTVENIASGVCFSKDHYQRMFRELVGVSVMAYVTKRKLTLAGRALLETDAAIIDIAQEYGYDSREGFSRSFKSYMGVSPTEYRKYGLAAISQKVAGERLNMTYSKTTDEIIRELNDFIARAKAAAESARKCELPWYKDFWRSIADKTDAFTDDISRTLERVSDIAGCPDQITNRFKIIRVLDDTAFILHVMAIHVKVTVARAKAEDYKTLLPLRESYLELGAALGDKVHKIVRFFDELSTLIIEDMRKAFTEKIDEVVRRAGAAADMIEGYGYIKSELTCMADELSAISIRDITAKRINDYLFKLPILQFSIDTDILRSADRDKAMFDGIEPLKHGLEDACEFIRSLPEPQTEEPIVVSIAKRLDDIGYEGNILLFYTRGEKEKLGELLDERQKASLDKICEKIDHYIHFTENSADEAAFKPIADRIRGIKEDMSALADDLGGYGGALRALRDEFVRLENAAMRYVGEYESSARRDRLVD